MRDHRILIVEDDELLLETTGAIVEAAGFVVCLCTGPDDALRLIRTQQFDACLCDMRLGHASGLDLMRDLRAISPHTEVIIATGYASVETAVEAMNLGAFQYITKPYNARELQLLLERAARAGRNAYDTDLLTERLRRQSAEQTASGLVVGAQCMRDLLGEAQDIAELDKPVLITGETGTGKDLIAQYVHHCSLRCEAPFNVLNCATLTESLVDAELFGHEKGAFTGADNARHGIIAASEGGTLFLDEIGDIPEPAQARLLRFLENGVVRPVGSNRERRFDVRIIAASHKNLAEEVAEGRFREDLYHRLDVFLLHIPALRERTDDIPLLCRHFLSRLTGGDQVRLGEAALSLLLRQSWPGNVRELRNVIERAWLRARRRRSPTIEPVDLQFSDEAEAGEVDPNGGHGYGLISLEDAQRRHIDQVVECCAGNRRRAAQVLGISERHLYRLLSQQQSDRQSLASPRSN